MQSNLEKLGQLMNLSLEQMHMNFENDVMTQAKMLEKKFNCDVDVHECKLSDRGFLVTLEIIPK